MKSVLLRTGSLPVQQHSFVFGSGSPRVTLAKTGSASPRISMHFEVRSRQDSTPTGIRRASSESDLIRSQRNETHFSGVGSRSFPAKIPEESEGGIGSLTLKDRRNYDGDWPEIEIPVEELEFLGGGIGKGRKNSGSGGGGRDEGSFTGGSFDRRKMGAYYTEMLKSNPNNSLLLTNYARFLHEVEGDLVKAEEWYGRAILASPGDGEVLSLYGKLIWESQRDVDRAGFYFDQAVRASPNNCAVLGLYAQFMWEAEEDDEEDERENEFPAAMVEEF